MAERTEPCPRRMRGFKDGDAVVDSRDARYAWLDKPYPVLAFPEHDVDLDRVEVEQRTEEGLIVPVWGQMDHWLEEDEPIVGHPRDPYHRVDARMSSRHVVVRFGGEVIAESRRPTMVFETHLPPRPYLPIADWNLRFLAPTDTSTTCPYKGIASYHSVHVGDTTATDAVWGYPVAMPDNPKLAGLLCPDPNQLEVTVDGEAA